MMNNRYQPKTDSRVFQANVFKVTIKTAVSRQYDFSIPVLYTPVSYTPVLLVEIYFFDFLLRGYDHGRVTQHGIYDFLIL